MATEVVGRPRDAGRPGDAAQAEDGDPLEIRPETEAVDQARVETGRGDAGDARAPERVHVANPEPGPGQRVLDRGGADVGPHPDPGVVRLGEARQTGVGLHRQREVPAADARVPVQFLDAGHVVVAGRPRVTKRRDERLLVDVVRGEGAADGRDAQRVVPPIEGR